MVIHAHILSILRLRYFPVRYIIYSIFLSCTQKRISFGYLQSGDTLGRVRSNMNMQSEKILMGGNTSRDEDRSETSCSESSYDSSSSDERKRYNSRKSVINVRNGNETPIGRIELEPDAFREAMNPDNSATSVIRGNNSRQEPGNQDEEVGGITPGDRYDSSDATSRDQTDNLQRKK